MSKKSLNSSKPIEKIFAACLLTLTAVTGISSLLPGEIRANERDSKLTEISPKSFVAKAVAKTGDAVVTIETQRRVYTYRNNGMSRGLLIDPYFERFFNFPGPTIPKSRIESAQGSGVIFGPEGLVLTNAHVVEKSDKLIVGLSDGRRVTGKVIGQDSLTDLAVILLQGTGPWPTANLGNSDKIRVGDWAIAVGNPFGLENTVTLGIISNLNRNVTQLGISDKRINLIQTDAAINPGNSGGPLLNAEGDVIGINTLVRSGPGAGLGFAIPINKAKNIANQLIKNGNASHPIIGVSLSNLPLVDKDGNESQKKGALIRYLIPGGPGETGGLKINDFILKVGGDLIKSPSDVVNKINDHGVNKPLKFEIKRGQETLILFISPIDINQLNMR
ncbi:trypsin-like peptidase domain-containing protein [Prochlorococcus sp. MIT 1223]|uniref:trypsin-like peptidase domain-containing protein n=1 Tax=Prochlorococcus sp. MIT 1223 TaxID=3096217 RepID=UPI002A74BAE1|nr:trypsin-like peptidase domain-containing protein [Prochlorococcus sp. MIT 1223]